MQIKIDGKTLDVVTIDFETYYDDEYSLSRNMNMSEYVRDERFKIHGVGIRYANGTTVWLSKAEDITDAFEAIVWANTAVVGHNLQFDGFILNEIFGIVPAFYCDTLAMSRALLGHGTKHNLHIVAELLGFGGKIRSASLKAVKGLVDLTPELSAELGLYCADDVLLTFNVFSVFYNKLSDDELKLIHITTRMFCQPMFMVDIPRVEAELAKEIGSKIGALMQAGVTAEDLLSNDKFAEKFKQLGYQPPTKISPRTGKKTWAFSKTDIGFLLKHSNQKLVELVKARLLLKSTIGETRAKRFLEAGKDGKALPVGLNYCGAHTTRWSGGNKMNPQNLKRGGELRRSLLAPEGHVVLVADSAQIEARLLAWLAGQQDIVDAFAAGKDVYKLMASKIYGVPPDQVTSEQRFVGKVCVLGLGYGMGAAKLQTTLSQGVMGPPVSISIGECTKIVNVYRSSNYFIASLWRAADNLLAVMVAGGTASIGPVKFGKEYVQLPNGLYMYYPELSVDELGGYTYKTTLGRSKIYGGLLVENIVQGLARCVIAEQMLRIDSDECRIVSMTHDEIIAIGKEEQAEQLLAHMKNVMVTPPKWAFGLPLNVEGSYAKDYSK